MTPASSEADPPPHPEPGLLIDRTLALLASLTPFDTWYVSRHRGTDRVVLFASTGGSVEIAPGQLCPAALGQAGARDGLACCQRALHWACGDPGADRAGSLVGLGASGPTTLPVDALPLVDYARAVIEHAIQQAHLADALRRRAERAECESTVDDLTRLYNRRGWQAIAHAESGRIQRYGSAAGLVMIDLDELKRTNDQFGHRAGDALLRHTAHVLRQSFRDSDVLARMGGDEFAALVLESDADATRTTALRVQESLASEGIHASVGWSMLDESRDIDAALHDADAAMYAAKCARRALTGGRGAS